MRAQQLRPYLPEITPWSKGHTPYASFYLEQVGTGHVRGEANSHWHRFMFQQLGSDAVTVCTRPHIKIVCASLSCCAARVLSENSCSPKSAAAEIIVACICRSRRSEKLVVCPVPYHHKAYHPSCFTLSLEVYFFTRPRPTLSCLVAHPSLQ